MPDQELKDKALYYAVDWTGKGSPQHLEDFIKGGLLPQHLQDFNHRQMRFIPNVESVLYGIAVNHLQHTGALVDSSTLLSKFKDGALARLALLRGEEIASVIAQARVAWQAAKSVVGNGSEIPWVVEELKKQYQSSQLHQTLGEAAQKLGEEDPQIIAQRIVQKGLELQEEAREEATTFSVGDKTQERMAEYERREKDPLVAEGLLTGFGRFDKETWGLFPGEVVLVSGQPKIGKTQFRQKILYNMWQKNHSVMDILREYYSDIGQLRLECMGLSRVVGNNGNGMSLIQSLARGKLNGEQKEEYFKLLRDFQEATANYRFVEPNAYRNLDDIEACVASAKREFNIEAIGVDDLHNQRLSRDFDDRDDLKQGYLMVFLKELAIRYKLVVIAEVQEPKFLVGKRDVSAAEAVMYSSKFAQKTNLLIRLYRDPQEKGHLVEAQVLAHRTGGDRYRFNLLMDPSRMFIEDAPTADTGSSIAAQTGYFGPTSV